MKLSRRKHYGNYRVLLIASSRLRIFLNVEVLQSSAKKEIKKELRYFQRDEVGAPTPRRKVVESTKSAV